MLLRVLDLDAAVLKIEAQQLLLHDVVYKSQLWAANERGLQLILNFLIPLPTCSGNTSPPPKNGWLSSLPNTTIGRGQPLKRLSES
jgi:hypothetical protein